MPELSVDEAQRLARLFLTGQASETDVQRLQNALNDDQGAALELLAQMQAALDDSAPAGLSTEQERSVNSRIESLILPRVRKRGPFAFILKFFRAKPKGGEEEAPAKARLRRRGAVAETPPAVVEMVPPLPEVSDVLGGDGIEDMAPIMAAPAVPALSVPAPRPEPETAATAPLEASSRGKSRSFALAIGLALVLLLGSAWGLKLWLARPKALPPKTAPVQALAPKPTVAPTPRGSVRRAQAMAPNDSEPLPAEFPATTPVSAGSWPQ